jgi:hypothetical protein
VNATAAGQLVTHSFTWFTGDIAAAATALTAKYYHAAAGAQTIGRSGASLQILPIRVG